LVSNSNLQQKYFKNIFIFSWQPKIVFDPQLLAAHPFYFQFSLIFFSASPVSFSAQRAQPTRLLARFWPAPLLSSSIGQQAAAATDSIRRHSASNAVCLRPLDRLLDASTPSPGSALSFPLPLSAESKLKLSRVEAPLSHRRLLLDHLRSLASGPITGIGTPSHITHSSSCYSFLPSRLQNMCPPTPIRRRRHSPPPASLLRRAALLYLRRRALGAPLPFPQHSVSFHPPERPQGWTSASL
jgi:hypothetical protein